MVHKECVQFNFAAYYSGSNCQKRSAKKNQNADRKFSHISLNASCFSSRFLVLFCQLETVVVRQFTRIVLGSQPNLLISVDKKVMEQNCITDPFQHTGGLGSVDDAVHNNVVLVFQCTNSFLPPDTKLEP